MTDPRETVAASRSEPAPSKPPPKGIGGWLVLPAIGLCLTPIMLGIGIWQVASVIFGGSWPALTTPGGPSYHPLYRVLLPAEIVVNVGMLIFVLALIFLFFSKSARVPKLMILFYLLNLAVVAVDTLFASQLPGFVWDREVVKDVSRTLITAVIWVPYFLVSRRVANTFVPAAPA